MPPAFPKDHVHADDLRRKDFAAIERFTQKEATTEGFLDRYETACRSFTPLMSVPLPRRRACRTNRRCPGR